MSRWILLVVLLGCGGDGTGKTCRYQDHDYQLGETWPAGDSCNECTCTTSGFECTARPCSAPPDANPATRCQPTGTCQEGPPCGAICCGPGEKCEGNTCQCGTGAACGQGDQCEAAGPVGGDACGAICCGASGPCPQ